MQPEVMAWVGARASDHSERRVLLIVYRQAVLGLPSPASRQGRIVCDGKVDREVLSSRAAATTTLRALLHSLAAHSVPVINVSVAPGVH